MYDSGSTAFMLVGTMLVLFMTPGLAFFYGGLARRKNVVNTMLMCFAVIGIVGLTWVLAGWSLAYGGDGTNPFIGGLDQLGLAGTVQGMLAEAADVPDGTAYPSIVDVTFQMAFALITFMTFTEFFSIFLAAISVRPWLSPVTTAELRNSMSASRLTTSSSPPLANTSFVL